MIRRVMNATRGPADALLPICGSLIVVAALFLFLASAVLAFVAPGWGATAVGGAGVVGSLLSAVLVAWGISVCRGGRRSVALLRVVLKALAVSAGIGYLGSTCLLATLVVGDGTSEWMLQAVSVWAACGLALYAGYKHPNAVLLLAQPK